jgi:hypothetical protein
MVEEFPKSTSIGQKENFTQRYMRPIRATMKGLNIFIIWIFTEAVILNISDKNMQMELLCRVNAANGPKGRQDSQYPYFFRFQ